MCEYAYKSCKHENQFWVMTQRGPDGSKQRAALSVLSCARHLTRAVRGLRAKNVEFGGNVHRPDTDGVVVKMRSTNPKTGFTFWV